MLQQSTDLTYVHVYNEWILHMNGEDKQMLSWANDVGVTIH